MTYQVLARRWRPQRFEDLVGQDVVVRTLRNALASGQVAHAFLFSGLRGVGKTTAARLLAKALNCEKGPTAEPCGECASCVEIAEGHSADVQEIDAASNRGIDEVRRLIDVARVLPMRDRYRVFILDEAHQLTKEAFGALLKILEEPPPHVVFILASTERDKFPATIVSRCQQLDFRPIPHDLIVARLAAIAASDGFALDAEAAPLVARAADGSLRDALSLLDRVRAFSDGAVTQQAVADVLGVPSVEVLLAVWEGLEAGDVARVLALLRDEEAAGRDAGALYDRLVELLQAMLLLACDQAAPVAFAGAHREALLAAAKRVGAPVLLRLAGMAIEQRSLVAAADRPATAVAVAVGRLCMWPRLRRVEALLAGEAPAHGAGEPPSPAPAPAPTGGSSAAPPRQPAPAPRAAPSEPPPPPSLPPTGAKERLADALEAMDEHSLAARVGMAVEVTAAGDEVLVRFGAVPPATLQSVRDAGERLAAAARAAGLPPRVRVDGGAENGAAPQGLRARVEADEAVQRVLRTFGGRIESVEEQK